MGVGQVQLASPQFSRPDITITDVFVAFFLEPLNRLVLELHVIALFVDDVVNLELAPGLLHFYFNFWENTIRFVDFNL